MKKHDKEAKKTNNILNWLLFSDLRSHEAQGAEMGAGMCEGHRRYFQNAFGPSQADATSDELFTIRAALNTTHAAARKLIDIANAIELVQDGRMAGVALFV